MTLISAYIEIFIRGKKSGGNAGGNVRIPVKTCRFFPLSVATTLFFFFRGAGLCGTYDGSPRNDLTLRSGRLWRESLAHRSEPPLDFSFLRGLIGLCCWLV